ncbi:uncharacterized protein LOC144148317 [Haemaphysalis longicornis]
MLVQGEQGVAPVYVDPPKNPPTLAAKRHLVIPDLCSKQWTAHCRQELAWLSSGSTWRGPPWPCICHTELSGSARRRQGSAALVGVSLGLDLLLELEPPPEHCTLLCNPWVTPVQIQKDSPHSLLVQAVWEKAARLAEQGAHLRLHVQDVADWFVESGTCEQLCRVLNGAHCSPFVRVEIVNLFDLLSDRITSLKWRRQLGRTITIDIVTKHDCREPGDVTWRKRQTERLLEDAERQHTTEVITLFPAVRGDVDVMESTLDALVSQAQRNLPSVEGTLWGPFTMAMVPHLRGFNAVRSALELLSALLPQPAVADRCIQPGCLATFENLVMKAATAGTTIRSLALVVWSHCLRHCLRGGQHAASPVVAGSVEAWLRTVASSVSEQARQAATADVWRFHAARSLRVAGSAVYVWAGRRTCGPPLLGALQSLFSTLLQLLQDEDPKIRDEAASAVPLECHEQLLHPVQANVAVKILLTEMLASCGAEPSCFEFLWTELFRSCPSALEELQHLLRPTVGSLFEQDESGVFLEPLVVSLVLRDGVQVMALGSLFKLD